MEVFAVVIVYCNAPIETKIPLLFDLYVADVLAYSQTANAFQSTCRFDFDHSKEISRSELILLMLCATRGLCKVVGLDRPAADELEELTNNAFASIDRDCSGQISLPEFSEWVLHEPSIVAYLIKFASTRVIYENQVLYDMLLKQLCGLFVEYAVGVGDANASGKHLACSAGTCKEIISRACTAALPREVEYLVKTMLTCMTRKAHHESPQSIPDMSKEDNAQFISMTTLAPAMISMDVFCTVMSPYVAFIAADEDKQQQIDMRELRVLLWLIRGKEPNPELVDSIMKSLDRDHNGVLSALEWVSYALENDRRTGNLSFTTQMQLLFSRADLDKDAALTLPELSAGLTDILMAVIEDAKTATTTSNLNSVYIEPVVPEVDSIQASICEVDSKRQRRVLRRQSQSIAIRNLVTGLANEFMLALDQNSSRQIEWYEFRQNLDYLEFRVDETKKYICEHIMAT